MHCSNCSEQISDKAEICPKCGVRQFRVKNFCPTCGVKINENQEMCVQCGSSLKKIGHSVSGTSVEPWLAALVTAFITGLGQIIIGQVKKGVVILSVSLILGIITFGMSAFVTVPLAVVDAYLVAKRKKNGIEVGEWEFF